MSLLGAAGALTPVYLLLSAALLLTVLRVVRGPSLPERVVALDLLTAITVGLIATTTIATDQAVFLDVAIVMALISFLGTTAFALYLARRLRDD